MAASYCDLWYSAKWCEPDWNPSQKRESPDCESEQACTGYSMLPLLRPSSHLRTRCHPSGYARYLPYPSTSPLPSFSEVFRPGTEARVWTSPLGIVNRPLMQSPEPKSVTSCESFFERSKKILAKNKSYQIIDRKPGFPGKIHPWIFFSRWRAKTPLKYP